MSATRELRALVSYLAALPRFLRQTITEEEAVRRVKAQLAGRNEAFLHMLAEGVFDNSRSPYRPMFREAGIEQEDVVRLVRSDGLVPALERLYDAGVRLTLDELKGRVPIRRGAHELSVRPEDFDNPLASRHLEARTGGSRGGGTPIGADLGLVEHDACYVSLLLNAFELRRTRTGVWFPAPPSQTGLLVLLRDQKLGLPVERWFSQTDPSWRSRYRKQLMFTRATLVAGRLAGTAFPHPEYTPPERASAVARWLAEVKSAGAAPVLVTNPGFAVRVCVAARKLELDIRGTLFRTGGEPYTAGRAATIDDAGCRAAHSYFLVELGGFAGLACPAADEFDEVHLLTDKIAVVARDKHMGRSAFVSALSYTTLHPLCPKLLINLESDDYGVLRERDCGCPLQEAGFSLHLHGIRSHDKLTSEGVTFVGSDVITLVEEALPSRFGGGPTDYQLVEQERDGLRRVAIVVSPSVGALDNAEVMEAAISFLRSRGEAQSMMAQVWVESGTLSVVRREPYVTDAAKTPALHVLDEHEA